MINFDKYTIEDYNKIFTKLVDHLFLLELAVNDIYSPITYSDVQQWLDEIFVILNNGELNNVTTK